MSLLEGKSLSQKIDFFGKTGFKWKYKNLLAIENSLGVVLKIETRAPIMKIDAVG